MPPDAPRWLLLCGDLAQPLPIATGSVDRVLCHNTLEALANPTGLLVEAHRVLRPGGGAVIGHSDFDTLVFAGADLALTRRLVHTYCDQQQPGWMDAVDGTIGRRLPALVSRSPLQVRQVHAQVLLEQAFAPWALGFMLAKGRSPWPPSPAGSPRRSWIPGWPACRSPRPRRLPVQHQRLHRSGHQRAPECHPRGQLIDIAAS